MKRIYLFLLFSCVAIWGYGQRDVRFYMNSGEVLFSYLCPNSVNGATVLLSSPEFTATSHTLMYGVTSVAGAVENYFDGVFLVGGTLSGGSSKSFTPAIR